jgi:cytosine/adenosine deaminase-related metal-dependent hydrolase/ribose/xylose/arabinose/galactoside ABC-type transport system permease subunit
MTDEVGITRVDRTRLFARKVANNARNAKDWRKIFKLRLWMPVVLQCLMILALLAYTESRFDGFINEANITTVLLLAMPLALAAMAQTHAILVGYLDLSVGAMISFGVVVGSFVIGADASTFEILAGVVVILACGLGLGLVNATLIRALKIPSLIATLATLSILDGISLTMRPTAQGVISDDLVSFLRMSIGPIPIAFIAIVLGAGLLDLWLHGSGSGLKVRAVGFDDRAAKRGGIRTNVIRVRALVLSGVIGAVAAVFVMVRSPIGNAQIGSSFTLNSITAAVLGGAALAGGRATFVGSTVAAVLLALIITALPFLGLAPTDGPMIIGVLVLAGIVVFQLGDLTELAKRNVRRARRLVRGSTIVERAALPSVYPDGTNFSVVPTERTLLQNGFVLSIDPEIGEVDGCDVLIDGDRIVAVGRGLNVNGAAVVDASGMIVMPGFVDSHRHAWEGVLRNIGTDVPLEGRSSYLSHVLGKLAPAFRPEDAYTGNLLSALGAIDAGITTLLDWSNVQASPDHTDAAIQALRDSGMRAVFAYGFPWWGKWDERQPNWFVRAANEHFATQDQMLTLALAAPGPELADFDVTRDHWKLAREAGARISTHIGIGSFGRDAKFEEFGRGNELGPDTTYIHCTTLSDTEIQMIVDTGGTVSLAIPVEMMMGYGMPPIQRLLDRGLKPSLSIDVETNAPSDMFNQMRSVLALQRASAAGQGKAPITARDVLEYATIEGARANGLDAKVGSLTPGKQADIITLRTDRMNVTPLNDPATAVVTSMDTGNVDTVMIGGRFMKRGGKLLHVDWPAVRRLATDSRDFVVARSGFQQPKI